MSILFICDQCEKQMPENEALQILFAYFRTPEELKALSKIPANVGLTEEEIKGKSVVIKKLDVCKKCYDEFKAKFFASTKK